MDARDLRIERSIALHAAVAAHLRRDPRLLDRARAKLDEWITHGGRSNELWLRWREVLNRPLEQVADFLTERSEDAAWLRKASPFAGILSPRTSRRRSVMYTRT
jgi:hypothetical protein